MEKEIALATETITLSPEFVNWCTDSQRMRIFDSLNWHSLPYKNDEAEETEKQSIGSGLESDVEDNVADNETKYKKEYDPSIDANLPPTVTLLTTPDGGKLYLVGTAHFSVESQNDVSKIIQAVQPQRVMVELCKQRIHALAFDEETLFKKAQNIGINDIRAAIKKHGVASGLMFILILSMSSQVTKDLGMAPGSEFRTAFREARKVPNCIFHLGDRPLSITMQRAFQSLSLWQKIKCGLTILALRDSVTKEDVEKCKNRDNVDELIAELSEKFPPLAEVFIKERDLFLTYSLQLTCQPHLDNKHNLVPTRAVGVVGIGHMPGIIQNWGKVKIDQVQPIMKVEPQTLTSKIICFTIKVSILGAVVYAGYKIIPSFQTIESLKSSVTGLFQVSSTK